MRRWLFVLSLCFLAVFAGYAVHRLVFLALAVRTTGTVIDVPTRDTTCGASRRRRGFPCTSFRAAIQFYAVNGSPHTFDVATGFSEGHGRPASESRLKLWDKVPVIYTPADPRNAYEDSLLGVWGTPIFWLVIQAMTFIASLLAPRGE